MVIFLFHFTNLHKQLTYRSKPYHRQTMKNKILLLSLILSRLTPGCLTFSHNNILQTIHTLSPHRYLNACSSSFRVRARVIALQNSSSNDTNNNNEEGYDDSSSNNIQRSGLYKLFSTNDQTTVGTIGIIASFVMIYSELVLKSTGCGLPAGPFGIVGAVEGISYLIVLLLGAYSFFNSVADGSGIFVARDGKGKGLIEKVKGPGGILIVAEGMSFLAIFLGLIVLAMQITNFGYIPNAVPTEGGMCK